MSWMMPLTGIRKTMAPHSSVMMMPRPVNSSSRQVEYPIVNSSGRSTDIASPALFRQLFVDVDDGASEAFGRCASTKMPINFVRFIAPPALGRQRSMQGWHDVRPCSRIQKLRENMAKRAFSGIVFL
jgi:hypothetical protein